jgi:hypothetical protein
MRGLSKYQSFAYLCRGSQGGFPGVSEKPFPATVAARFWMPPVASPAHEPADAMARELVAYSKYLPFSHQTCPDIVRTHFNTSAW